MNLGLPAYLRIKKRKEERSGLKIFQDMTSALPMSRVVEGVMFGPNVWEEIKFTSGLASTIQKNLKLVDATLCFPYTISMWKYLGFV